MKTTIRIQLSTMMFLQYFIWCSWYVTMGTYLLKIGFSGLDVGAAFSTVSWGAIVSPFIMGIIADRFFSAEKVMAFSHLVGAALLWYVLTLTSPGPFFWTVGLHYAVHAHLGFN